MSQVVSMVPPMGWDVWEEADRRAATHVRLRDLPDCLGGAIIGLSPRGDVILIDPNLDGPRRSEALAHELVHQERGISGWDVARDEQEVNDEVARRLLPRAELVEFIRGRLALGEGTSPSEVADTFGVSGRIARRALALLYDETGGQV